MHTVATHFSTVMYQTKMYEWTTSSKMNCNKFSFMFQYATDYKMVAVGNDTNGTTLYQKVQTVKTFHAYSHTYNTQLHAHSHTLSYVKHCPSEWKVVISTNEYRWLSHCWSLEKMFALSVFCVCLYVSTMWDTNGWLVLGRMSLRLMGKCWHF